MKRINIYIAVSIFLLTVTNTSCTKLLEEKPKATAVLGELSPELLDQTMIGV